MSAEERREEILTLLKKYKSPIIARELAERFNVSRQVIVGDIALLRAAGQSIYSTPKGYVMREEKTKGMTTQLVCVHRREETREELYTIVDCGCEVLDVIVEHPFYGMIRGDLNISSRLEVDEFLERIEATETSLLSTLTHGIHTHTIRVRDEKTLGKLTSALKEKGYLYE
ncbi:transcription repressor NadR [Alkalibacterium kapii]|uniref:Transcriptional regulator n=1 Tax=Alkalibacterium kapii TaxID=426704 RepID=A0A511AR55_9LACT|nr:transcription repressor NadR [Alkalibacterium kapii]GEK90658.1 transcriptional regulator [Alkalibacterium kapii]